MNSLIKIKSLIESKTNKLSLNTKLMLSFLIVITISWLLNIILLINFSHYSQKYNDVVTSITLANSMNKIATEKICPELWYIVAGRKDFKEGKQYEYLNLIKTKIAQLKTLDPSEESIIRLDIISRTTETLKNYIDFMHKRILNKSQYDENVKIWSTICEVSTFTEENIYEYKIFQANKISKIHNDLQRHFKNWIIKYTIIMFFAILFCFINSLLISYSISKPIKQLYENTCTITEKYLNKFSKPLSLNEITGLKNNFEILIYELGNLIKKSMIEHENAKKAELKVLQEQINPHFLYNSLDTVIGMIETNNTNSAIKMVKDLSHFYRISLSKGKTWVKIKEEIEHIRYYLQIQKIRYYDILDYQITFDPKIYEYTILKFILQPIVENALYHGIKPKRQKGMIYVNGLLIDNVIHIEIVDDGIGIPEEKLRYLNNYLNNTQDILYSEEIGFGLLNVNQRIKIYYGKDYGLKIESKYNLGSKVIIEIPYT